ncbi:MAG: hypothetical protein RSB61_03525 [Clostridia bacterium]
MRTFFSKNCEVAKIAMLFVGTVIGAGFATGREILVFFRHQNIAVVALAGLLLGGLCGVFLAFGKIKSKIDNKVFKLLNSVMELLLWASAISTFLTMVCGGESIIFNCWKIENIGLWSGIFVAVLSFFDIKFIKNINFILVPLIAIMIIFLTFFVKPQIPTGANFGKAIEYCAMNIMLGGYVICDEGRDLSAKQMWSVSAIVAVVFGIMLVCVYLVAMTFPDADMPIFAIAQSQNVGVVSGVIIYFAIFTTLVGSGKMIYSRAFKFLPSVSVNIIFLAGLATLSFDWNFAHTVDILFPLSAYVGIGYLALVGGEFCYYFAKTLRVEKVKMSLVTQQKSYSAQR